MLWGGWTAQARGSGLLCFTAVFFPLVPQALSMLLQAKARVHSPAARSRALTKHRNSSGQEGQDQNAACSAMPLASPKDAAGMQLWGRLMSLSGRASCSSPILCRSDQRNPSSPLPASLPVIWPIWSSLSSLKLEEGKRNTSWLLLVPQ